MLDTVAGRWFRSVMLFLGVVGVVLGMGTVGDFTLAVALYTHLCISRHAPIN
jgi:hypothetical protein